MASLITLCNRALSKIYKAPIASLDEGSFESAECSREAGALLDELAAWSDCFAFTKRRDRLAAVENDRPAEWLYSYSAPNNMATPLAVREQEDSASYLPTKGPFTFPMQDAVHLAFLYENGLIYTNVEKAVLVFTVSTIEADDLPPLGQLAFVSELAARLAMPLAKEIRLAGELKRMAEADRARWIADEENRNPRMRGGYVSHAEYARLGYVGTDVAP